MKPTIVILLILSLLMPYRVNAATPLADIFVDILGVCLPEQNIAQLTFNKTIPDTEQYDVQYKLNSEPVVRGTYTNTLVFTATAQLHDTVQYKLFYPSDATKPLATINVQMDNKCYGTLTPTPVPTITVTNTVTPTIIPTEMISPTATSPPTLTPTSTLTPTIVATSTVTPFITSLPTSTPTITVTLQPLPTYTLLPTYTPYPTNTAYPTLTIVATLVTTPTSVSGETGPHGYLLPIIYQQCKFWFFPCQ